MVTATVILRTVLDADVEAIGAAKAAEADEGPMLTSKDSQAARAAAEAVAFPEELLLAVAELRAHLRDEADPPVNVSDRRLAKAVRLVRLAAHASGAKEVSELDLLVLQHVFWDREAEQSGRIREWLLERFSAGTGNQDQVLPQVHFFLAGIVKRLSRRPLKDETASVAQTDLGNLRQLLEEQLRIRTGQEQQLRRVLGGGDAAATHRTFWLQPAEVTEAKDRWLPRAAKAAEGVREVLREVCELQAALEVEDGPSRERCARGPVGRGSWPGPFSKDCGRLRKTAED